MKSETAQRFYEFRKANGYSQEELADKIGVSRQAISKWERSESSPDTDNLIALAELYGVTIDELLNGKNEPKREPFEFEYPKQTGNNYSQQYNYTPPTDETFGTPESEKPKKRRGKTYYTPNGMNTASGNSKKGKRTAIIIAVIIGLIICAVTIVSVAGIITGAKIVTDFDIDNFIPGFSGEAADSEFNTNFNFKYEDAESYDIGSAEAAADKIDKIEIAWVSGSIAVEYYDVSTIKFSEPKQPNPNYELRHRTNENELQIKFCKSGINDLPSKNLLISLPYGFPLGKLNIETVSSPVTINDIDINVLDIETVSGKITASGSFETIDIDSVSAEAVIKALTAPESIDIDTMSGDARIAVPFDTEGFTLKFNSMSGNYELNNFDLDSFGKNFASWGSGKTKIDYNSVSGDFMLTKESE